MATPSPLVEVDFKRFRQVLGHFPTGVVVITATAEDGTTAGMAVGSFTSVSLDPPLVAFLPDRGSTSFPKIRESGSFCVNVLTAEQEHICRAFASKSADKFAGISWRAAGSGSPIIDDAVAWIDCKIDVIHEAGDHYIVVGRVLDLDISSNSLPLVFFQGGYGRFAPLSLVAPAESDLLEQLRVVDLARGEMERLAGELEVECLAAALVHNEIVIVASAGSPSGQLPTRVGQRIPFIPPLGGPFVAWAEPSQVDAWLSRLGPTVSADQRAVYRTALDRIRDRGWSLGTGSATHRELEVGLAAMSLSAPTPEQEQAVRKSIDRMGGEYEPETLESGNDYPVRNVSVPVFGPNGRVVLMLSVYGLPARSTPAEVDRYRDGLTRAAAAVTTKLGGHRPA